MGIQKKIIFSAAAFLLGWATGPWVFSFFLSLHCQRWRLAHWKVLYLLKVRHCVRKDSRQNLGSKTWKFLVHPKLALSRNAQQNKLNFGDFTIEVIFLFRWNTIQKEIK